MVTSGRMLSVTELGPGPEPITAGFSFPAPKYPAYLRQERTDDVEALLPLARSLVRRKYGRMALNVEPEDEILIITAPHQNLVVFEVMARALKELGARKVDQVSTAVNQLDQMTQQNAALVEEAAAAAQSLDDQARALKGLVGKFVLG